MIKEILMKRDGMSPEEAQDLIDEASDQMHAYLDEGNIMAAEDVCDEFFGLEPDYLFELI